MAKVQVQIKAKGKSVSNNKKTTFKFSAPYANSVSVAGDFNNWDVYANPLKKDWKGDWTVSITLKPGRYEYKFYVDDSWQNDTSCCSCVPNRFGSTNCVIEVK